jgi:hypothetical protein
MLRDRRRLVPLLLLALGAALMAVACDDDDDAIQPSGNTVSESFDFADFDAVSLSRAFEADVERAAEFSVQVTIDDNLRDRLVVEVRGDTLHVGLEPGTSVRGGATLEARVALPKLRALDLSGASRVRLSGFDDADDVDIDASGASRVSGELTTGAVRLRLSGASSAAIVGSAETAMFEASGASNFDLADFIVGTASVELSGASRAEVHVTEEITQVEASGASRLVYRGDPRVGAIDSSGASTIEAR